MNTLPEPVQEERINELLEECESALEHGESDLGVDCIDDIKLLLKEVLELREEVSADIDTIKELRASRDFWKGVK